MNLNTAKELAKQYINNEANKSVFVTSDHAVYINSDKSVIEEHCKANKLEMFVLKEENVMQVVAEVIESKQKKNKKS